MAEQWQSVADHAATPAATIDPNAWQSVADHAAAPDQWQNVADAAAAARSTSIADKAVEYGKDALQFIPNAASSLGHTIGGMAAAAWSPWESFKGLATAVGGMAPTGNSAPLGSWQHDVAQPQAAALAHAYKDRYGGLSNIGHTLYTDPFGAAADASVLMDPAEAGLRIGAGVADAAHAAGVASALRTGAEAANTFSTYTNPMTLAGKGLGSISNKVRGVRQGLSPAETAAVDYAINDPALGGTVDAATASGNQFLKSAKSLLRKSPLSAGPVGDSELAQQAAITGKMGDIADTVSPGGASYKSTAGQRLQTAIDQQLDAYRNAARDSYENGVFKSAEANPVQTQTGTRPQTWDEMTPEDQYRVATGEAPQGAPVPIMQDIAGPTSTAGVKAVAKPILDQLETQLGVQNAQVSPTVNLLRQIMQRPDAVSLRTAIADNSAIQDIARSEVPQLRKKVQALTAQLVPAYRDAIDNAAKAVGPNAYQALEDGRTATKMKYELGSAIPAPYPKQMRGKPVGMVNLLTMPEDAQAITLQKLQNHVPGAIPDLARATVESIFRSTTEGGQMGKLDQAMNKWNKLGPETRKMLFGNTSDDITNLLHYAKMAVKDANPSGSASVGSVAGLAALLLRDPMSAIAAMAGSRGLASAMFDPEIASAIRQTGKIPLPKAGWKTNVVTAPLNPRLLNEERATNQNPYRQ